MLDLLRTIVICFSVAAVVLPVAFLIAYSLPHNSEFRQLCLRVCYWGFALAAVCYFAMPLDLVPDFFFPVGLGDDLLVLGLGVASARKAMRPWNDAASRN